jgi:hypothetical protein
MNNEAAMKKEVAQLKMTRPKRKQCGWMKNNLDKTWPEGKRPARLTSNVTAED